jgi:hypothetical protein
MVPTRRFFDDGQRFIFLILQGPGRNSRLKMMSSRSASPSNYLDNARLVCSDGFNRGSQQIRVVNPKSRNDGRQRSPNDIRDVVQSPDACFNDRNVHLEMESREEGARRPIVH